MKQEYKKIKGIERAYRRRCISKRLTIDMLINIRSHGIDTHQGLYLEQLRMIKEGQKVWNGDVQLWILRQCKYSPYLYEYPYRFAPKYGQRHYAKYRSEELPF